MELTVLGARVCACTCVWLCACVCVHVHACVHVYPHREVTVEAPGGAAVLGGVDERQ